MRSFNSLKILVGILALVTVQSAAPANAVDEHSTVPGLSAADAALGLYGIDPVAFIRLGNRPLRSWYGAQHAGCLGL